MSVSLGLLAGSTSFDVAADKIGETRPPKLCHNQLVGFQEAGMSSGGVIMVAGNDGVAVEVIGNIDSTLEGEDASVILPVGEAGLEGWGDLSRHRLEGSEDNGIGDRGSCQLVRERGVDEFDKERVREEGDGRVVVIICREKVRVAGEGVRGGEEAAWDMDHFEVKICKVKKPLGLVTV